MAYYVYVIELDQLKFFPPKKYRSDNPHVWDEKGKRISASEVKLFYVGQSAHKPKCRFLQHKHCFGKDIDFKCICGMKCECCDGDHIITKNRSNPWVREHGLWLRERIYRKYNPILTYELSIDIERKIAEKIRSMGHAAYYR